MPPTASGTRMSRKQSKHRNTAAMETMATARITTSRRRCAGAWPKAVTRLIALRLISRWCGTAPVWRSARSRMLAQLALQRLAMHLQRAGRRRDIPSMLGEHPLDVLPLQALHRKQVLVRRGRNVGPVVAERELDGIGIH